MAIRRRSLVNGVIIGMALAGLLVTPATAESDARTAVFRGARIPLREVRNHHCHNAEPVVIRCFSTESQRDADLTVTFSGDVTMSLLAVNYVTFYEHASYGGLSLTVADSISNLGSIGWNDAISSFKSLNGQRPRWWQDSGFTGTSWQWTAGAWVSNVGAGANDKFSSVSNSP